MLTYRDIFENNSKWAAERLAADKDFFVNLSKGQSPDYLYIGCSDSRVTAAQMMGAEPGDLFVHRNIANQVRKDDLNFLSVLRFAVETLKVKHIIVCGHTNCGGVKAAMSMEDLGKLEPWIWPIRETYLAHKEELDKMDNELEKYDRLVELNVLEQCKQLKEIPEVLGCEGLLVHGWVYDMRTGALRERLGG